MSVRPESVNIPIFEIFSCEGNPVSVSGGLAEMQYYESLLDNTIRVTANLVDTGNKDGEEGSSVLEQENANLTAGEKVHLVIKDENTGTQLVFKNDTQLRIKEIKNIVEDTSKTTFTVDLYSKESIDNELSETRVTKRYDGKISDSVEKILKQDCLKTPKSVEIDPCLNTLNFIGNTQKPFYKLAWLAKRTVPEIPNSFGDLAGYFFYETSEGYKFKSIDVLFQQTPKKRLIFNNTTGLPEGYDSKILKYKFNTNIDLHKKLQTGSVTKSELRELDLYGNKYTGEKKDEFDSDRQFKGETNAGKSKINVGCDIDLKNKTTKINTKIPDIGVLPSGRTSKEQLEKSKEKNFDSEKVIRQSTSRYNNLFNVKLTVYIYGDLDLHVGDLIHCDFPEVSSKNVQSISQKKSGIYMIVDLSHLITSTGPTYTKLNLVRDSIGRKPF